MRIMLDHVYSSDWVLVAGSPMGSPKSPKDSSTSSTTITLAKLPINWVVGEVEFKGHIDSEVKGALTNSKIESEEVNGKLRDGIALVCNDPGTYEAVYFQDDMPEWPEDEQSYTIIKRGEKGRTTSVQPAPGGGFTWIQAVAEVCTNANHDTIS